MKVDVWVEDDWCTQYLYGVLIESLFIPARLTFRVVLNGTAADGRGTGSQDQRKTSRVRVLERIIHGVSFMNHAIYLAPYIVMG